MQGGPAGRGHVSFLRPSFSCSGSCPCTPSSGKSGGNFSDGSGYYTYDQTCTWLIAAAAKISLRFTSFDTESDYDFVTINLCTSSDCDSKVQVARLSGSDVSSDMVFNTSMGYMQIEFTSDSSVQMAGFEAVWTLGLRIV